ncbi:hypothetical protein CMI37_25810 [Candidatus Pacearchaeota archaeon]|nr:hypothetical protein [Candidatus Pacearchaeota archaeon]|tara:strand:+ start:425 stop:727 length:303 start_codon:yes stop_codon:yes gene_type:complete
MIKKKETEQLRKITIGDGGAVFFMREAMREATQDGLKAGASFGIDFFMDELLTILQNKIKDRKKIPHDCITLAELSNARRKVKQEINTNHFFKLTMVSDE